jgi:diadenosine tetraphosphate (Ap4A) HIT family hydrolase
LADTGFVTDWPLCRVLLMNDQRFPWLVLVPRCTGATELYDLAEKDRVAAVEEVARAAHVLRHAMAADKINIGALGNLVPQLHLHVVARRTRDAAWPAPVWGFASPIPYGDLNDATAAMRDALAGTAVAR